jgi:Tol biopolymer transport system component
MGAVLFLVDADTNGDGRIDYRDEFQVRILSASGGTSASVTQAASAIWSPDGKYIAAIHNSQLEVIDPSGQILPATKRPSGRIILSDSLNPQLASDFRAVDPQAGTNTRLPDDLAKKYLWLGMMSPDGTSVVYPDATRRSILMRQAGENSGRKLVSGNGYYLDPAWSPDGKYVVYVSTEAVGPTCGRP